MAFPFLKKISAGFLISTLAVSGCNSDRFNGSYRQPYQRPASIEAAPRGQVSQSQLPPLGEDYDSMQPGGLNDPPQISALDMSSGAIELSPSTVAGVWKASVDGMPCQIATPMTKFGQGYRAGPMRCPLALTNINSWNVEGRELVFYNREGERQVTLYSNNGVSFVGRTLDGVQIILNR